MSTIASPDIFAKVPEKSMYNYPTEVAECKRLLKSEGISDDIIDRCFIPDETETKEEVMGSVIMAVIDANMQEIVAEKIINAVFVEMSVYTVPVEPDTFVDLVKANGLPVDEVINA